MKKKYIKPQSEVVEFESLKILCASGGLTQMPYLKINIVLVITR